MKLRNLLLLLAIIGSIAGSAAAGPEDEGKKGDVPIEVTGTFNNPRRSVPLELIDPPFERFVDVSMLGEAIEVLDATMLADAALQLGEGERVLLRSHKAFNSDHVAQLALKVAVVKNDKQTINRLKAFAEKQDNKNLKTEIAASEKLVSTTRAVDPAAMIAVEDVPIEHVIIYRSLLDEVSTAALVGDEDCLKGIEEALPNLNSLTDAQRGFLKKKVSTAKESLGGRNPESSKLKDLLHAERGFGKIGGVPIPTPNLPRKPEDLIPRKPQDLIPNTTSSTPGFQGYNPKAKPVEIQYTIANRSGKDVGFQLFPSGKTYTLKGNDSSPRTFTSHQIDGRNPWIKIFATNETFNIPGGNFQFYSDKGQIRWSYR